MTSLDVPHDRLRHRHRLALAARQPGHGLADRPQRRDRQAVERLPRRAAPCAARRGRTRSSCARGPRNMLATTSRLSASARSWYTTSMPEPAPRRAGCGCGPAAPRRDLALVEGVDAGDALDQASTCRRRCRRRAPSPRRGAPRSRPGRAPGPRRTPWTRLGTRGWGALPWSRFRPDGGGGARRAPLLGAVLLSRSLAELRELADADLVPRAEPVGDHGVGDVVGGHRDRLERRRTARSDRRRCRLSVTVEVARQAGRRPRRCAGRWRPPRPPRPRP